MAKNKWMTKLLKLEGAIQLGRDVFANPLKTDSPSVNFIFGKTHGLPFGYTATLFGPPKGGKSVLLHMMIGWLHKTDPEAIAIKIDTEYRSEAQLTPEMLAVYGIDVERLLIIQANNPKHVFDQIEKDIAAHCQAGAPIRLIAVDSVSGVNGRREMESDSISDVIIGDHARTIGDGLKRVLPVIRKHAIALALVCHARGEMDQNEQKRSGKKFKMQGSFGLQHMAEYFVIVEENVFKSGKQDAQERSFYNDSVGDMAEKSKGEKVAMKIDVTMKASSLGPKERHGEFTFHFKHGVVNTHEEVFQLGKARGIIYDPETSGYAFGDKKWRGKDHALDVLRADPQLCQAIVDELIRRDMAGVYADLDTAAAVAAGDED